MDKVPSNIRSKIMAQVRSRGNRSTELQLIKSFKEEGIKGWRRNFPLIGKPDFVFPKLRLAVFVDGCFWHGCSYHCRMPNSRKRYWVGKINANKIRDKEVTRMLKKLGWHVVRIWEHDIKFRSFHGIIEKIAGTSKQYLSKK